MARLLSFLAGCAGALLSGLTLYWGWTWFLIPIGVPAVSYWPCVGLIYLLAFLTQRITLIELVYLRDIEDNEEEKRTQALNTTIMSLLKPLYYLLFLWLVHFLI